MGKILKQLMFKLKYKSADIMCKHRYGRIVITIEFLVIFNLPFTQSLFFPHLLLVEEQAFNR